MKAIMMQCACCGVSVEKGKAIQGNPWGDKNPIVFCSYECLEVEEERVEDYFLASCDDAEQE